jgi:histone H3/H4
MSPGLLIPALPFQRLVREIMYDVNPAGFRIQRTALLALQEAAEAMLCAEFQSKFSLPLNYGKLYSNRI